jgi:hypothetical protein
MKLPPLEDMWPEYPLGAPDGVAVLVGGTIGNNITKYHWETCCIRLSRALNYGGRPVQGFAGMANPYMDAKTHVRAAKGADSKWYIYSCYDLRVYLQNRFGYGRKFGSFESSDLSAVRGIIMFEFRHVDLWNGTEVRYNTDFTDGTKTVKQIIVWEAPAASPP